MFLIAFMHFLRQALHSFIPAPYNDETPAMTAAGVNDIRPTPKPFTTSKVDLPLIRVHQSLTFATP